MLDVNTLAGTVQELYRRGLAQSSTRAYDTGKRQYLQFCRAAGLTPLPVSENTLCLFVAYLSQKKLQHSTVRSYLSAVRHLQISAALPDPATSSFPRLSYVLKGLHRITKPSSRHRLPITPAILDLLYKSWSKTPVSYDARLLWAACNVGFFGFFRAGEFTSRSPSFPDDDIIAVTDVTRDPNYPPSFVCIRLRRSKTDPFSAGVDVYLGRTGHPICPVAALLAFLAVRPADPKGPLFRFLDGTTLCRDRLIREVRTVLRDHGFDHSKYHGHSFRIGAATSAAAAGIPDHAIKMLGRWDSSAYLLYVRTPPAQLAGYSAALLPSATPQSD